jgi:glycosyltransferase involved in cell wall biosynthesis
MHVAIVCEEYPPAPHGGTGSSYRDLAEGLVLVGHKATVVGINATQPLARRVDEETKGVRIIRLPRAHPRLGTRLGAWWERWKMRRVLAQEHARSPFDVVEGSDYHGWLAHGGVKGVPSIVRIRGSNLFFDAELRRKPSLFEHKLERTALERATHLAAVSRYAAERTLALCDLSDRECSILPNGVDVEHFSPSDEVVVEKELVVFVSVINPKKGIEELITAANEILPKRPAARFVAIGGDTQSRTGAYIAALMEKVHPEVRNRFEFTGRMDREKVVPWLQRAAVCCYPSHMETFGIAALEAMSVGRPTIFTKLGPGPEVVEDGVSGLLCDPRDPRDIARCITSILDDEALALRLGNAARERVLQHFDKRDWIARNVAFFEKCLRKS